MFATAERILLDIPGSYHDRIQVVERGQVRYMRFGPTGGWQGAWVKGSSRPEFAYQRAFASLAKALESPQRFLAFGVGTGTALKTMRSVHADCDLFGIEMDEQVISVAIEYFESPDHRTANYWVGDGIPFLSRVDLEFDFIFVDAYLKNQVYTPILNPTFPRVLSASVGDHGVVALNVIASLPFRGALGAFVREAYRYFPTVLALPVGPPLVQQNILLVLSKSALTKHVWAEGLREDASGNWLERHWWPLRIQSLQSGTMI